LRRKCSLQRFGTSSATETVKPAKAAARRGRAPHGAQLPQGPLRRPRQSSPRRRRLQLQPAPQVGGDALAGPCSWHSSHTLSQISLPENPPARTLHRRRN